MLDLGCGLGDDRFGLHRGLLFALLRFGLALESIQIAQQTFAELLFRPRRIEIICLAEIHERGLLCLEDLETDDRRSRAGSRRFLVRRLLLHDLLGLSSGCCRRGGHGHRGLRGLLDLGLALDLDFLPDLDRFFGLHRFLGFRCDDRRLARFRCGPDVDGQGGF